MSFILDALKKSETDRQRQNGPALFEVRVAPPRSGLPLWAVGLGVLLAVNLVIVAWVLLRRPATVEVAAAVPAPAQAPPQQMAPQMATSPTPAQSFQGAQQGQPMGGPGSGTVPVSGTPPTAPVGQTAGLTQPLQGAGATATAADPQPTAGVVDGSGAQNDAGAGENPDDYAPAADPGPIQPFSNHVAHATANGVPLYQDAILAPGANIPEVRLDLHVFAAKPQDRFVMINMKKLHEGDSLPNGVHVDSITPEGAVLSHNGAKFLLPRQ